MSDFSVVTSEEKWWIFSSLIIRVHERQKNDEMEFSSRVRMLQCQWWRVTKQIARFSLFFCSWIEQCGKEQKRRYKWLVLTLPPCVFLRRRWRRKKILSLHWSISQMDERRESQNASEGKKVSRAERESNNRIRNRSNNMISLSLCSYSWWWWCGTHRLAFNPHVAFAYEHLKTTSTPTRLIRWFLIAQNENMQQSHCFFSPIDQILN